MHKLLDPNIRPRPLKLDPQLLQRINPIHDPLPPQLADIQTRITYLLQDIVNLEPDARPQRLDGDFGGLFLESLFLFGGCGGVRFGGLEGDKGGFDGVGLADCAEDGGECVVG